LSTNSIGKRLSAHLLNIDYKEHNQEQLISALSEVATFV